MDKKFLARSVTHDRSISKNPPTTELAPTRTIYPADSGLPRLNEKQLADRWGLSVRTVQAARAKGTGLPFIRIGRTIRYRMEDVLAYEQAHLRISTSETL